MPVNPNKQYVIQSATARQIVLWVLDQARVSTRLGGIIRNLVADCDADQASRHAADYILKHATSAEMDEMVSTYSAVVGGAVEFVVYDCENESYDDEVSAFEDNTASLIQRAFSEARAEKIDKLAAELAQESTARRLVDQVVGS